MHLGMTGRFIVEPPGSAPVEPGAFYAESAATLPMTMSCWR